MISFAVVFIGLFRTKRGFVFCAVKMPRPKNLLLRKILDRNEFNKVVCNYGKCEGKVLSEHAGNIGRHLRLMHPKLYASYLEKKNTNKKSVNIANITKTYNLLEKSEAKKSNIELAIVEFFTKSERPLSMLEDHAFQVLAQPAFATLAISVNRNSVLELISSYAQKLKVEIIDELNGNLFALKVDVATREDITLLGINVHYIKDRQLQIKSLAIKELQPRYTSDYLKSLIMEVLNEYSINMHEILSITTSNDANILDAVKELNEDLRSSLGVENTVSNISIKKENGFNSSFEEWLGVGETDFSTYRITSVLSGIQTLQLCVDDILESVEIKKHLDKCQTLIKELRTHAGWHIIAHDSDECKENVCVTKWISIYELLEKLPDMKDMISTNNNFHLKVEEWSFINEFLAAFKPIYKATLKLLKEQICYSELYIVLMNILFDLEKMCSNKMAKSLIDALNKQKAQLLEMDLFNAAVFLDPRIRVCLDSTQKARAKQYIITLYNRISTLKGEPTGSETNDSLLVEMTDHAKEQPTSSNKVATFGEFLQNLDADPFVAPFSYLESDLTMYERQPRLPLNENIIDFWFYQHNTLSDIAHLILAIPCAEVSAKRLSSAFQYILADKQNRLSASNIDHILGVKVNGVFNYAD